MLSSGKSIVRIKNTLGDDVYGLWHVKKIVVQKGRQRYAIIPHKQTFSTKDEAVYYAYLRARRFVEHKLRQNTNGTVRWKDVMKYLCAAGFMTVMISLAFQWWRDRQMVDRSSQSAEKIEPVRG